MSGGEHYATLIFATILVAVMTLVIWLKTRQVAFVLGCGFLYYWSLYGAWNVIARDTGSTAEFGFEYLYQRLFPVFLDSDYIWAILLYTLFIFTIQFTVLVFARPAPRVPVRNQPIYLDHRVILVTGFLLACGALWIVRGVISTASAMNVSAYAIVGAIQSGANPAFRLPLFSLYQVLDETALGSLTLGVAVLISGPDAKYILSRRARWVPAFYAVVLAGVIALNVNMGNRSTMVFAILPSGLFYLANARVIRKKLLACAGLLALSVIIAPGIVRSASAMREVSHQSPAEAAQFLFKEVFSQQSEAFASHASMYGALSKHVPFTYGSSLLWLAGSLIPRVMRPELVPVVYEYYAEHVGAATDQGFTIHHATGWYLNFGIPGIIIGGALFGFLWSWLYNRLNYPPAFRDHFARVFFSIAVWNFTGFIPTLIRGGPESYKGLFAEALLAPSLIVTLATVRMVMRENRPRLLPAQETSLA